jgi:hypothetical protein
MNPERGARWDEAIATVVGKARSLAAPIGAPNVVGANWYPSIRPGSKEFVGRHALLWRIASDLHRRERVGTTGARTPELVQLTGLPGMGKSLLAIEYAHRFSAGYPGGVFWIDGAGDWDSALRKIAAKAGLSDEKEASNGLTE